MNQRQWLKASGVLVLGATTTQWVIHLLSDAVKVDTGAEKRSVVTITRTGRFNDPRYGEFELIQSMFDSMIKNFNDGFYGREIFIDIAEGLSDEVKKELKETSALISVDMSDEQVTKLTENQIKHGNEKMVSIQLNGLGFGSVTGSLTQTPEQQRESLQLQAQFHSALRNTNTLGQLRLTEEKELPCLLSKCWLSSTAYIIIRFMLNAWR